MCESHFKRLADIKTNYFNKKYFFEDSCAPCEGDPC